MKKISLKTIKEGLSRDEMRSVKAGGCFSYDGGGDNCTLQMAVCGWSDSDYRAKFTGPGPYDWAYC